MLRYRRGSVVLGAAIASLALVATTLSVGSTAAVASPRSAGTTAAPFTYANPGGWGDSWTYNLFATSGFPGDFYTYVLLPLAMAMPPKFGVYTPELASSWKTSAQAITVTLRKGVKWQDNKPLTSTDVLDTLLLDGINGNTIWENFTAVKTAGPRTVIFDLKPKVPAAIVLSDVLGTTVVPGSVYSKFLTPGLQKNLLSYYTQLEANTKSGKTTTTAFSKALAKQDKSLQEFHVGTMIGDGPFKLVKMTTSDILMKKWDGFWDASKIAVPEIDERAFASNDTVYPALFSHRLVAAQTGAPAPIVDRFLRTPGIKYTTANNYGQFAFYFNSNRYPFNMLAVRKAIVYLIDRKTLLVEQDSGRTPHVPVGHIDGLIDSVAHQWLTPSQIKSLNPYPYDPTEAAKLLTSAHFKKVNGEWIMPNGKPFTISLGGPSGWSGPDAGIIIVANRLTKFGIKTKATAVEQPGYWTQQDNGEFQMDWGWLGDDGLNPLNEFAYDFTGTPPQKWINFSNLGPVPGLGKLNVKTAITTEEDSVSPGPKMAQLTWDWARYINQELPAFGYGNKHEQFEYTTNVYTDWPKPSSKLWDLTGYNLAGGYLQMMEDGYIRPVH